MTTNVGTTDRIIRLVDAAVLGGLILTNTVEGTLAWVCGVGAAAAVLTAVFRFCGLYTILGISTCKVAS
jgi:energy-converting hydrogenase Eha subunit H